MNNSIYTKELEEKVIAEYITGDPVKDICDRYNIDLKQVDYIVRKHNISRRHPRKTNMLKSCPKCRKKVDVKGARYCPFCGSDIRTEGEQLAERLKKLCEYSLDIAEQIRDEFISTLKEAMRMVQNERH